MGDTRRLVLSISVKIKPKIWWNLFYEIKSIWVWDTSMALSMLEVFFWIYLIKFPFWQGVPSDHFVGEQQNGGGGAGTNNTTSHPPHPPSLDFSTNSCPPPHPQPSHSSSSAILTMSGTTSTTTSAIVTMTSTPSSARVTDLFDTERGADPGSQVCCRF